MCKYRRIALRKRNKQFSVDRTIVRLDALYAIVFVHNSVRYHYIYSEQTLFSFSVYKSKKKKR